VGGNRGKGKIYPDGNRSNDTVHNVSTTFKVNKIIHKEKGGYKITIDNASNGPQVIDIVPTRLELIISEGESIKVDQPLTNNPNVGGFGQGYAKVVLRDPLHVQGLLLFFCINYIGTNISST
jgi:apocytochrome f